MVSGGLVLEAADAATRAKQSIASGKMALRVKYVGQYGDWHKMFTDIEEVEKVTAEDVQRVAKRYLVAASRTVAYTVAGGQQ